MPNEKYQIYQPKNDEYNRQFIPINIVSSLISIGLNFHLDLCEKIKQNSSEFPLCEGEAKQKVIFQREYIASECN